MKKLNELTKYEKLAQFLKIYGKNYGDEMVKKIKQNYDSYFGDIHAPAYLMQIYHALGELEPDYDIYRDCVRILRTEFGYELAKVQKLELGCGTVTLYDPNLVCDNPLYSNVTIIKKPFTSKIDLSKYDLIVSLLPCEISFDLVKAVAQQDKECFILPCKCQSHRRLDYGYEMYFMGSKICNKNDTKGFKLLLSQDSEILKRPILYRKK